MSGKKIVRELYGKDRYEGEISGGKRNGKGIYYFDNGNQYDGEWKDDEKNGKGIFIYNDGERYDGEYKNDEKNGKGIFHYKSGSRYDGEWKDNKQNGKGIFYFINGDVYDGEYKDDEKNGKGIFYFKNGNRYDGEWKDDKMYGKGIFHYNDGNRYEGEYRENKQNGKGIYYYHDGSRYEGENRDNQMNGKGIFYYNNGNRYEGEYKDNKRNGKGIFYFNNGSRYDGEYEDGKMSGEGIYYYLNGNRYEGEFEDNKMNGKGIFYYNDGERYDGEWKDDMTNGRGIFYFNNGDRFEGEYENDEKNGKGIFYFEDGKREKRQYRNGKLLRKEPLNSINIETSPQTKSEPRVPIRRVIEMSPTKETFSRFAFLVGQNEGELVCCVNDATKMSQKLEKDFGYNCTLKTNLRLNEFESSFKSFLKTIEEDSSINTNKRIFFYFSGHGYEEDGKLFLMCKGKRHMKLDKLLRSLNQLKSQVHVTVIVDACRDDESNETWKPGGDGNSMTPPQVSGFQKSFILGFACASGKRSEANQNISLYTSELLSSMSSKKNETIMEILSSAGDRLNSLNQVRGKKYDHQQAWVNLTGRMETLKMKL